MRRAVPFRFTFNSVFVVSLTTSLSSSFMFLFSSPLSQSSKSNGMAHMYGKRTWSMKPNEPRRATKFKLLLTFSYALSSLSPFFHIFVVVVVLFCTFTASVFTVKFSTLHLNINAAAFFFALATLIRLSAA